MSRAIAKSSLLALACCLGSLTICQSALDAAPAQRIPPAALAKARGVFRGLPLGKHTVLPPKPCALESSHLALPALAEPEPRTGFAPLTRSEPVVSLDDFGAKGDGYSDDTSAIEAALASLSQGGTLLFTPGKTYVKTRVVTVVQGGTVLWGDGACLYSVTNDDTYAHVGDTKLALRLAGPRTAIHGLTLATNNRGRPTGHPNSAAIWLSGEHQQVVATRVERGGIFVEGAKHFLVAGNIVYRSSTDGIHMTNGTAHGWVLRNIVRETGDDMIAVVSYGLGESRAGDVHIEENDLADQYWGRGISVVGGHDVVVARNKIARTPFAAGILVHSETGWKSSNVRKISVIGNQLRDIQLAPPRYSATGRRENTGHGAIDIYGQGDQRVEEVRVEDNTINGAGHDGIFIRGNACAVTLRENRVERAHDQRLHLASRGSSTCQVLCESRSDGGVERVACEASP